MSASISQFRLRYQPLQQAVKLGLVFTFGHLALPGQVFAQNDSELEEIIVTAQFREENLQATPIAITAITAEEIEIRALTNSAEIGYTVPNASFRPAQGAFGNTMTAYIRGIGQNDFNFAFEPGVGVYIDDVYFPTTMGSLTDLMDLERVEVLRGPQGTLFGRGSIGGAIRFVSSVPEGEDGGTVQASYGEYNRVDVKGSYDFSITDQLFARVSAASKVRDGYQKVLDFTCVNPVGAGYGDGLARDGTNGPTDGRPDIVAAGSTADNAFAIPRQNVNPVADCQLGEQGNQDQTGIRGILRWLASDDLEFTLTADHANDEGTTPDTLTDVFIPGGGPFAGWSASQVTAYGIPFDQRFIPENIYTSYATYEDPATGLNFVPGTTLEQSGVSGKMDWSISDTLAVTAIISDREYNSYLATDNDGGPLNEQMADGRVEFESKTAEIRLNGNFMDRIDYTVGYFHYEGQSLTAQVVSIPAFGLLLNGIGRGDYENDSVFAHAIYDFTDRVSVTFGARWSEDIKDAQTDNTIVIQNVYSKDDHVDYRLGLDYQLSDEMMVYASTATGYRPPAFNPRPFQTSQFVPVDGEEATSYELGVKGDFLNNTLRTNVAAFFIDYNKRIVPQGGSECTKTATGTIIVQPPGTPGAIIDPNDGTGLLCLTTSLTKYVNFAGESQGIEVEATWQPIDPLSFSAVVGYTDWASDDITANSVNDFPVYVPEQNWNLSASYELNLGNGGSLTPRLDLYGQSDICTNNTSLRSCSDGYEILNARIDYSSPDAAWNIAAGVTNVTNEEYFLNKFDLTAFGQMTVQGQPGRPSEWYITVRRDF